MTPAPPPERGFSFGRGASRSPYHPLHLHGADQLPRLRAVGIDRSFKAASMPPTGKIVSVGMRKLSEGPLVKRAMETLKGRARSSRAMWSRRVKEYEAKINSGDIVSIAEVIRDLYRSNSHAQQTYSDGQFYNAALERLSCEIAAVESSTETEAIYKIEAALANRSRRRLEPDGEDEVGTEEAA